MRFLLGWAEPYLRAFVSWIGDLVNRQLLLSAGWRDQLVLVMLVITALARVPHPSAVKPFSVGLALGAIAGAIIALPGFPEWYYRLSPALYLVFGTGILCLAIGFAFRFKRNPRARFAFAAAKTILGGIV